MGQAIMKWRYILVVIIFLPISVWLLLAIFQPFEKPESENIEILIHRIEYGLATFYTFCIFGITGFLFFPLREIAESESAMKVFGKLLPEYIIFIMLSSALVLSIILMSASAMPSIFSGYNIVNPLFKTYLPNIQHGGHALTYLKSFIFDKALFDFVTFTGITSEASETLQQIPASSSILGFALWLFNIQFSSVWVAFFVAFVKSIKREVTSG